MVESSEASYTTADILLYGRFTLTRHSTVAVSEANYLTIEASVGSYSTIKALKTSYATVPASEVQLLCSRDL